MSSLTRPQVNNKVKIGLGLSLVCAVSAALALFFYHHLTEVDKAAEMIKAGNSVAAIPILEQMSLRHPDDASVYPWLAQGYLIMGRVAEGRTALDTALKLKQSCTDLLPVVFAYAHYYQDHSDFEEARKLFESAASSCPEKALTRDQTALYIKWSKYEFDRGDINNSTRLLAAAVRYLSADEEPARSKLAGEIAQLLRDMAITVELSGDDPGALRLLATSLQVSDEPETRKAIAEIDIKQGKIDAAIENYTVLTHMEENNLEAGHRLIELLLQKRDYATAREALLDLTDHEKSVENYQLLTDLNLKMDNFAGAAHALQDALSLKPNDLQLLSRLSEVLKAWAGQLRHQGKADEAASVEANQERAAELVTDVAGRQAALNGAQGGEGRWSPGSPPVSLTESRVWLASGSLTPEGQIKIKNICGKPIADLSLTVVFYDHTVRNSLGTVVVPVAALTSSPLQIGESRLIYFSCPKTVQRDHRLAVKLFWQERFLNEFPIMKP